MAVDLKRLAAVAVDAALKDERPAESGEHSSPTRRATFGGLRGVAAGAAMVAAARFAAKRAPSPMSLVGDLAKPDFSEIGDRMRDLIDDWFGEEDAYDASEEEDGDELDAEAEDDDEDEGPSDELDDEDVDDEADEDELDAEADDDIDDEADEEIDDDGEGEDEDDDVEDDDVDAEADDAIEDEDDLEDEED